MIRERSSCHALNDMKLVRVVAPHFVADLRPMHRAAHRADPQGIAGGRRSRRKYIQRKGWKASIVNPHISLIWRTDCERSDRPRALAVAAGNVPKCGSFSPHCLLSRVGCGVVSLAVAVGASASNGDPVGTSELGCAELT